ncbi:transcription coregulator [Blomia tropicalis]|nr:transcription coregulator [Blomia tropicalis]
MQQLLERYKDRLVQALDDQYNVKDLDEVKRIISVLERTHVTREDLERTRLGKYINEFRRKTTDKDLAKRAKKLIKTWQSLTIVPSSNAIHSNSTTPNAALTSPFNLNSNAVQSPYSNLSNDSSSYAANNISSYAPGSGVVQNGVNGKGSSTTNNTNANGNNSHPALWRLRNQHVENSKTISGTNRSLSPSSSSQPLPTTGNQFRPQTASPRESSSLLNGHGIGSQSHNSHQYHPKSSSSTITCKSNLTSPVNTSIHISSSNGLSPNLRNSFKNILDKGTLSPSIYRRNQRTTPPTPFDGNNQSPSSSAASSQHCSPSAFSFVASGNSDSRDSTSFPLNRNSTYSNQPTPPDEDSNSSVFSNHSIDGPMPANPARSLLDDSITSLNNDSKRKRSTNRKRKTMEIENDSLRENLNSIKNSQGGRRLQSTQELVQKLKLGTSMTMNNNDHPVVKQQQHHFISLSASSSPHLPFKDDENGPRSKRTKTKLNGVYKNGFHHHDENTLGDFESAIFKKYETETDEEVEVTDDEDVVDDDNESKSNTKGMDDIASCVLNSKDDVDNNHREPNTTMGDIFKCDNNDPMTRDEENVKRGPMLTSNSVDDHDDQQSNQQSMMINDENRFENNDQNLRLYKIEDDDVQQSQSPDITNVSCDQYSNKDNDDDHTISCSNNNTVKNEVDQLQHKQIELDGLDLLYPEEEYLTDIDLLSSDKSVSNDPFFKIDDPNPIFVDLPIPSTNSETPISTPQETVSTTETTKSPEKCESLPSPPQQCSTMSQSNPPSISEPDSPMDTSNSSMDEQDDDKNSKDSTDSSNVDQLKDDDENSNVLIDDSNTKPKRTKRIVIRVMKKKFRKCFSRSKVKRSLVDRIAGEHWESVNGNYDKDGVWHDFGEMTSAYVLRGGENASNDDEDNVLHILPYVNYTW